MARRVPRYLREERLRTRLVVDATKLAHWSPYLVPPEFWEDRAFVCRDCGSHETWTAAAQKWWFEEVRGPQYSRAIRCPACRVALRHRHAGTPRRSHRDRSHRNRSIATPSGS